MSLAERRWLRLFTLCILYVGQGIPWGFTAIAIPRYLGTQIAPAKIGVVLSATTLPYALKWVWGPIVDSFTLPRLGRRRPWIIFAQGMMALTILAMLGLDVSEDVELLATMIMVHTFFSALQDVAVDALGVDLLSDDERGRANSLMYASKYAGGVLGGFGLLRVIEELGLSAALVVQVAMLVAIMLVPILVRERATTEPTKGVRIGEVAGSLAQAFSLRSTLVAAVLALAIHLPLSVLAANAFSMFPRRMPGLDYTLLSGLLAPATGCGAAVATSFIIERVGHRRTAAFASIAMALGWVVFGALESRWSDDVVVYTLALYEAVTISVMTVSLFAVFMDVSWPKVGASQFTAYMALLNFSATFGYRLVGVAQSQWTDQGLYFVAAAVQLPLTAVLLVIDPQEARTKLPRERTPIAGIVSALLLVGGLVAMTSYVLAGVFG